MKKVFAIIFILFLTGCFSSPSAPKWVNNVPQDNNEYFYATGEGFSKEGAIKQALNNIASRLNVNISSELLINKGMFKDKVYNEVSQQINAKVSNIHFNNYETIKYKNVDNTNYVLLKVNKNKLKQQILANIQLTMNKIAILANQSNNPLQIIKNSYSMFKLIAKTKRKVSIVQSLGANVNNYINQLQLFTKIAETHLQQTKFSLRVNDFKQISLDVLSKYFNISSNASLINISISLRKNFILKKYLITGVANIHFQGNKTVTIRFNGSSFTDYKNARFVAGEDFKNKLNTTIRGLLGL